MLITELTKKLRIDLTSCIVSLLMCVLCATFAQPVRADEAAKPQVITLEHEGAPGFWFPRQKAIDMQKDVEELRVVRSQIKLLDQQLALKVERIDLLREIANTNKQAATEAKNVLAAAIKGRREAEEDRDSFFAGKPWFWIAVGVVTGIVTSVVLVTQTKD